MGVAGAPPLLEGEIELLPSAGEEGGEVEDEELIDVLEDGGAAPVQSEFVMATAIATTGGVVVRTRSGFQGRDKESSQMVWAYEVTIANQGKKPVQVGQRRHSVARSEAPLL